MNKTSLEGALKLRRAAMDFLARREHSRQELALKLRRREHPQHSIGKVLDELREDGLQSDTRFAESYLRSRVAKGDGPVKIEAALKQRGVAQHILEACMADTAIDWDQQLHAVWLKKYHGEIAHDARSKGRQLRFLQSRGYPADLVFRLFK
ncbi:MAG: regulatory protein RecX [Pseudomonadales bacterium]